MRPILQCPLPILDSFDGWCNRRIGKKYWSWMHLPQFTPYMDHSSLPHSHVHLPSCSDAWFLCKIPVGMHASMLYFLSQTSIPQLSRYVQGVLRKHAHMQVARMCVRAWVGGRSVLRIRPQKMLIRVDLGTWSECLMDRVQGQTSP